MTYTEICEVIRLMGGVVLPEGCHMHLRFIPMGHLVYKSPQIVFGGHGKRTGRAIRFVVELDHVPTHHDLATLGCTLERTWAR